MLKALKGSRGSKPKRFIGLIGTYLVEILDNDQLIRRILAKSKYRHIPSLETRFSGPTKRMILKTFSNDALIIMHTKRKTKENNICKRILFINNSEIPSSVLLKEARRLAEHRWSKISF